MLHVSEFYEELILIDSGNPTRTFVYKNKKGITKKEKKNFYRSWLKHGLMLALYGGGRRREEIAMLRWSEISPGPDGNLTGGILNYRNLKVERQNSIIFSVEQQPIEVPIPPQLADLLAELGYQNYQGTDQFILASEISNRKQVMNELTKGFTHYYSQLPNSREGISFKSIRKTYITHVRSLLGSYARIITGHSSDNVINQHYEDRSLLNKKIMDGLKFGT